MNSLFMRQLSFTLYEATISRWVDSRLTITYQKPLTEHNVKALLFSEQRTFSGAGHLKNYFILHRNHVYMFPAEGNEILFASWLSNNWKTKPVANRLVHKKNHVFHQIARMYFGFIQMNFLSSGSHFYYCLQEKGWFRKPGIRRMPCEPQPFRLCPCRSVTLTVPGFVFDRWREVGKALTWKQHGKLLCPFAWGERTGVVGARAPRCVIWLQLLWVQTVTWALPEGRE